MPYLIGQKTADWLAGAMRGGSDLRSRRRNAPRAVGGDGGAVSPVGVIVETDAGEAGPRVEDVRDQATWELLEDQTVCPAEIAGQFTGGANTVAWVVAIRIPSSSIGEGAQGE